MFQNRLREAVQLSKLRVMIVDRNEHMRMLVKSLLFAMGFRVFTEAEDGRQALLELRRTPVDLIITGWEMEPIGGLELIQTLRRASDSPCPRANIIILTAYAARENIIEARNAGMTEFLTKPLTAEKLYTRVMSVLKYPRPFVDEAGYKGPCRRRTFPGGYEGTERRSDYVICE